MPRRREVPKREILPDPKFGNVELSKFMNVIMEGGKKAVAERIIYGALELIEKKHPDKDPLAACSHPVRYADAQAWATPCSSSGEHHSPSVGPIAPGGGSAPTI